MEKKPIKQPCGGGEVKSWVLGRWGRPGPELCAQAPEPPGEQIPPLQTDPPKEQGQPAPGVKIVGCTERDRIWGLRMQYPPLEDRLPRRFP